MAFSVQAKCSIDQCKRCIDQWDAIRRDANKRARLAPDGAAMADPEAAKRIELLHDAIGKAGSETAIRPEFDLAGDRRMAARS